MLGEIVAFLGVVFIVALVLLWRGRRGGSDETPAIPMAEADRPDQILSTESSIGPNRSLGRTWRVDQGERPSDSDGEGV
jgi:hypothetical protein